MIDAPTKKMFKIKLILKKNLMKSCSLLKTHKQTIGNIYEIINTLALVKLNASLNNESLVRFSILFLQIIRNGFNVPRRNRRKHF